MGLTDALLHVASQRFARLSKRVLASSGYTLEPERIEPEGGFGFWSDETAERQQRAWRPLVDAAKAGRPREDIAAMWDAVETFGRPDLSLLEVGAGGGHNSELLTSRIPGLEYTGLDIAPSMIELALRDYPGRRMVVGSAYELPFDDASFDVVLDGVALLHMSEWRRALQEYARVARAGVVLHGLTLTESVTTRFGKYAYGQPSVEYVFNRAELAAACVTAGLVHTATFPGLDYDLGPYIGVPSVSETWVLRAERS